MGFKGVYFSRTCFPDENCGHPDQLFLSSTLIERHIHVQHLHLGVFLHPSADLHLGGFLPCEQCFKKIHDLPLLSRCSELNLHPRCIFPELTQTSFKIWECIYTCKGVQICTWVQKFTWVQMLHMCYMTANIENVEEADTFVGV